ncbi:MAG: hypothetical protein EA401_00455 [Planctomycetota bacterium]|nr:MAG: hypothetical protein EA401_00455 [Planctomycetota bacterium]
MSHCIRTAGASVEADARSNRSAIQGLIDRVAAAGGGVVSVPAGTFSTGGLTLRSGITLRLEAGAVLLGSDNFADYDEHFIEHFSTPGGKRRYTALIFAHKAEDIAIEGPGTIDGNGGAAAYRCYSLEDGSGAWHKPSRPWGIRLWQCQRVRLDGYQLRSSAEWGHHLCDCDHLDIRNLSIFNHANANNDGLDVDGCRDVEIQHCDIDADDDAFCIKSTGFRANRRIHLHHCRLASRCRVINIGSESSGDYEDILIEHCDIRPSKARHKVDANRNDDASAAISICTREGSHMRGITLRDCRIDGVQAAFFIHSALPKANLAKYAGHDLQPGSIQDLNFARLTGICSSTCASSITAAEGVAPIHELSFEDCWFSLPGSPDPDSWQDQVPAMTGGWETHSFGQQLPACGCYLRRVTGLRLHNLVWHRRSPDPRPDMLIE